MIPFRVCCGRQHFGPVCPDGKVMCCICFDRVPQDSLAMVDGDLIDVCIPCHKWEMDRLDELNN